MRAYADIEVLSPQCSRIGLGISSGQLVSLGTVAVLSHGHPWLRLQASGIYFVHAAADV